MDEIAKEVAKEQQQQVITSIQTLKPGETAIRSNEDLQHPRGRFVTTDLASIHLSVLNTQGWDMEIWKMGSFRKGEIIVGAALLRERGYY
ncbi:hypothetical protein MMC07_001958 [Pseudocyphellaria aurata]|nr:hypothetical protein [Pseudocyphellaria aurata]